VLAVLLVIAVTVLVAQRIRSAMKRARGGKRSIASSIQRIFMTYAQTTSILSASKMQPPEQVTDVVATTAAFTDGISASAYPVQCALGPGWDFYAHTWFYMIAPVVAVIGIPLLLVLPATIIWQRCIRPCHMAKRLKRIKKRRRKQRKKRQRAEGASSESESESESSSDSTGDESSIDDDDPRYEPIPSHWFFNDAQGYVQGPCTHAHLRRWYRSQVLDGDLLIVESRGGVQYGDWRRLRELDERRLVSESSGDSDSDAGGADAKPHWMFVDHAGVVQGPCEHEHMLSWWQEAVLSEHTWIATASASGDRIGEWRPLRKILEHVPMHELSEAKNVEEEKRLAGGHMFTKQQFVGFYGGTLEWEAAKPALTSTSIEEPAATAAAAAGTMHTVTDGRVVVAADAVSEVPRKSTRLLTKAMSMLHAGAKRNSGGVPANAALGSAGDEDVDTPARTRRTSTAVYDNHFRAAARSLSTATGAAIDEGAVGEPAHGADAEQDTISRAVLASILPPGIKSSDLDAMIRKFGKPVQPRTAKAPRRTLLNEMRRKRWKRRRKRKRTLELKKLGQASGQWQRFVDVQKGAIFYINSQTLERREQPPLAGTDAIEMVTNPSLAGVRARGSLGFAHGGGDSASSSSDSANETATRAAAAAKEAALEAEFRDDTEYHIDSAGFALLQRHLENQRVKIAVVTTLIIVVYFMYMRVTRSLIEVFSIYHIDGVPYLARALEHRAYTSVHNAVQLASVVWLVGFTLGMPIIGFGTLAWMYRTGRENDPRWRTAFGFLNDGYRHEYYWWEAAVLARKLLILLVAVVLSPDDGFLQAFAAVCVLAVAMILQAWVQPYEATIVNVVDMAAMAAVFATRLGAILFAHFDPWEQGLNKCRTSTWDPIDLGCKAGRVWLGNMNGFVLLGIQGILIALFAAALGREKIADVCSAKHQRKFKIKWATFCAYLAKAKAKTKATRASLVAQHQLRAARRAESLAMTERDNPMRVDAHHSSDGSSESDSSSSSTVESTSDGGGRHCDGGEVVSPAALLEVVNPGAVLPFSGVVTSKAVARNISVEARI
jgi:hypothetical protein